MTENYYKSLEDLSDEEIEKMLKENPVEFQNGFIKHSYHRAVAMIGRLKSSSCRIVTEGYGHIMSAATLLLAAGKKRRISKYCIFMTHQMSYYVGGSHAETKEEVAQVEKQERQWCNWMAELSDKDAEFWYDRTYKKNFYLTPQECLDLGVIDEIF